MILKFKQIKVCQCLIPIIAFLKAQALVACPDLMKILAKIQFQIEVMLRSSKMGEMEMSQDGIEMVSDEEEINAELADEGEFRSFYKNTNNFQMS